MVRGIQEKYDELPSKDSNAVYFITDSKKIYLGDLKMSSDAEIEWGDIEAQIRNRLLSMNTDQNLQDNQDASKYIIVDNVQKSYDYNNKSIIIDHGVSNIIIDKSNDSGEQPGDEDICNNTKNSIYSCIIVDHPLNNVDYSEQILSDEDNNDESSKNKEDSVESSIIVDHLDKKSCSTVLPLIIDFEEPTSTEITKEQDISTEQCIIIDKVRTALNSGQSIIVD